MATDGGRDKIDAVTNDPAVEPGRTRADVVDAPRGDTSPWRTPAIATAAVFALNATVIASWVSRLPATRDRLELDPRAIGLVLLMMGIGSLSMMPFVGRLAARWSSRPVVVAAATVCALCLVALTLTPDAITTGAVLFVLGAGYGSWDVAMNIHGSYVDRSSGRDYMPRYHGSWSVGLAVGAGLGALAAGLGLSLTAHFVLAGLIGCGGSIALALRFFRDDRAPVGADGTPTEDETATVAADGSPRPRLMSRRLVLIGVITLCGCLLEGAAADWVALYLTDERGATAALAAAGLRRVGRGHGALALLGHHAHRASRAACAPSGSPVSWYSSGSSPRWRCRASTAPCSASSSGALEWRWSSPPQ